MQITQLKTKLTDKEGKEISPEVDNIVLAAGVTPDKALGESLKGKYSEFAGSRGLRRPMVYT